MPNTTTTDLLSTSVVASRYGVSLVTVQRWCRTGRLPCVQLGRDWFVSEADLASWEPPKKGNQAGNPTFGPDFWTQRRKKKRSKNRRNSLSDNV